MPVYWLISLPLLKGRRDHTWELLQEKTSYGQQLSSNAKLEVPELRVGTLDTLLAHSDDLVKISISTEAIVTKIRRTIHDVAGSAGIQSLKIENLPVESYLTRFRWDEPKFPTRRPVKETIEKISEIMGHVEDDLKVYFVVFAVQNSSCWCFLTLMHLHVSDCWPPPLNGL
jgi:V-type H+-transporting ATPase subunit C